MKKGKEAERIIKTLYDIYCQMTTDFWNRECIDYVFINEHSPGIVDIIYNKNTFLKRIKYRLMEDYVTHCKFLRKYTPEEYTLSERICHVTAIESTERALKDIDELLQQ